MVMKSTEQTFGLFCTFILYSDIISEKESVYVPTGNQPQAIEQLVKGFQEGN